jgi:hypothetical protein
MSRELFRQTRNDSLKLSKNKYLKVNPDAVYGAVPYK